MSDERASRFLDKLAGLRASLTPSERKVADVVLESPEEVMHASITHLAERAGVGDATVSRFCRQLGLAGFHQLKIAIAQELSPSSLTTTPLMLAEGDYPHWARNAFTRTVAMLEGTVSKLDGAVFEEAIEAVCEAEAIHFFGQAASGVAATDAALRFLALGRTAHAWQDSHVQAMSAALVRPTDIAVAMSVSGSTRDTVDALRLARSRGARTLAITGYERSPIAEVADMVLIAGSDDTMLATNLFNKIPQLLVIELLVQGCARRLGASATNATRLIEQAVADKLY